MISVCIPVYNFDIRAMVSRIHAMGTKSKVEFEILVIDDASSDTSIQTRNAEIQVAANIRYKALQKNNGRNLIKFQLAHDAAYDHLLFLDADSEFRDELFFSRYLQADWRTHLIVGGRTYSENKPQPDQLLHWVYGRQREQRNAKARTVYPYRSFLACNFLISKPHIFSLIIDPALKGYCHEDTFMGMQFEKHGIPIRHIDNPVIHLGLDTTPRFLDKQEEALYHLSYIYKKYKDDLPVRKQVRLLQAFERLKNSGTLELYRKAMLSIKKQIHKNLCSQYPSLFLLDMYKLGIFIEKYSGH